MPIPGMRFFIANPFFLTHPVSERLKAESMAFQQAMECVISDKRDTALPFREEVRQIRKEIDELETEGLIRAGRFQRLAIRPTLCYRYLRAQGRVAHWMEKVLDWILLHEVPTAGELPQQLFLLADSAGETVEDLEELGECVGRWVDRPKGKNRKKALAAANRILEKTNETQIIARRTKLKILETATQSASLFHLLELARMIERMAEDSEEVARIASFVLNS